jgi:recA bacterial DNA recombination protein
MNATKAGRPNCVERLGKNDRSMDVETISSGSLGLDIALGVGGLPRGRVVEIFGPESSGKTTLALHTVAEDHAARDRTAEVMLSDSCAMSAILFVLLQVTSLKSALSLSLSVFDESPGSEHGFCSALGVWAQAGPTAAKVSASINPHRLMIAFTSEQRMPQQPFLPFEAQSCFNC